jgi:8-oxo-dGTP pyrophosphatase MutT (NUDIX family)
MDSIVKPRAAATLVLLRDGVDGIETLLMQRNAQASFMPGAYVFPGGALDPADADLLAAGASVAAVQTGIDDFAARIAAIRECFEECGVLLANSNSGGAPDAPRIDAPVLAQWRHKLMTRAATFSGLCRKFDLTPRHEALVYHSRWVTPPPGPKRFDTRFFLARCPDDQDAELVGSELTDFLWLTPREALQRADRGTLFLVTATRATLGSLLRFGDTQAAIAFTKAAISVPEFPARADTTTVPSSS